MGALRSPLISSPPTSASSPASTNGNRRPTKTPGSARTVPIPPELAIVLTRHRDAVGKTKRDGFVFATGTGRPLQQQHVARALRETQRRAVDSDGRPGDPILHGQGDEGHAFLLGHRDGTVTRTVYVREVADARRRAMRRSRMAAEFSGALRAALHSQTN